jgi:plasmid stabilization system protein ParE
VTFEVRVTVNARRDRDRVIAWLDENHPDQSDRFIDDYFRTLGRLAEHASVPGADEHGFRHLAFDTFRYH